MQITTRWVGTKSRIRIIKEKYIDRNVLASWLLQLCSRLPEKSLCLGKCELRVFAHFTWTVANILYVWVLVFGLKTNKTLIVLFAFFLESPSLLTQVYNIAQQCLLYEMLFVILFDFLFSFDIEHNSACLPSVFIHICTPVRNVWCLMGFKWFYFILLSFLGCNLKILPAFRFLLQPRDEITFSKILFTANKPCHQRTVYPTIYSVATRILVQSAMFISFFFSMLYMQKKSRNPCAHNTAASNKSINKTNWKRIFKWTEQLYVWI